MLNDMLADPAFLGLPSNEQARMVSGFLKSHEPTIKNPDAVAGQLLARSQAKVPEPPMTDEQFINAVNADKLPDYRQDIKASKDSLPSVELNIPERPSAPTELDRNKAITAELFNRPVPQAPTPEPSLWDKTKQAVGQMGEQIGQGLQTEFQEGQQRPKDFNDFLMRSLVTRNPFSQAGLGAISEGANLANGISTLFGGPRFIPTGGLEDLTAKSPLFSTIGRAVPYVLGEGAAAGVASKMLPNVTAKILASPVARTLAGTGVQAAEGYLVDPGEGGDRNVNAVLGGVLGGGLHVAGELVPKFLPKDLPVAPEQPRHVPYYNFLDNQGNLRTKLPDLIEVPSQALTPDSAPAVNPAGLAKEFVDRGGYAGNRTTGNLDAQILGPDGSPVHVDPNRLRSSYEVALEKTRQPEVQSEAPRIERTDLPVTKAGNQIYGPSDVPIAKDLDLHIPSKMEAPELYTPKPQALDLNVPTPKAASKVVEASDHSVITPQGAEIFRAGQTPEEALAAAQRWQDAAKNGDQLVAYEDALRLLDERRKAGYLTPEAFEKQKDALHLYMEAGRNAKTINAMRREIQEGLGAKSKALGKSEVKTRDELIPVALVVKSKQPRGKVQELIDSLGSSEAARTELRGIAEKLGITPTTKAINRGDIVKNNAVEIAKQIDAHPRGKAFFRDVYLGVHNYRTGGERAGADAFRAYPLRTVESLNVGTSDALLPKTALYQNKISEQFSALEQAIATTPEQVRKPFEAVLQKDALNRQDIKNLRKALSENMQHLEQFCQLFGFH